jgi:hypothetical protein
MDPLQSRIIAAHALLKQEKRYNQVTIVKKLSVLGYEISAPSFSLAVRGKSVGDEVLSVTSAGLDELIWLELGHTWQKRQYRYTPAADWQAQNVAIEKKVSAPKTGFIFHDHGRLPIHQKVDFFSRANKEIVELGITLNSFSSYFFTRNEYEFKIPVMDVLKRGVDLHCYLLDPVCNEAHLYFEDRSRIIPDEKQGIEKINKSLERLRKVAAFFDKEGFPGTFQVFTYRHIPTNYFLLVDPGSAQGEMMISHYIYGQLRAQCPVLEIHRKNNSSLYRRYWQSAQYFIDDAKVVIF